MALNIYTLRKKVSLCAYLFLFLSILTPLDNLYGQEGELTPSEEEAYQAIISLKPDEAKALLSKKTPGTLYLQNLSETIDLIIAQKKSYFDQYEKHYEQRLELLEDWETNSPYKKFYLTELYLQSAFVNLKMGNEWSSAWDFRRAYKLIQANMAEHPKFLPQYKSIGLLHIMIGSIPEKHQWFIGLLGMEGSVTQGLNEIDKIANSDHFYSLESRALKHLLQAYVLSEAAAAANNFVKIYNQHPNNLLFGYLYTSLLLKSSQGDKALKVLHQLSDLQNTGRYLEFNFLNYLRGEVYMQKGEYPLSQTYYNKFIENHKDPNFLKDAYYKLFLTYWLSDNENKAVNLHLKAQQTGTTVVEADKHASRILSEPNFPNKTIMQIRLFTDGGFYEQAMEIINQQPQFNTLKDKVEYDYRKARLFHKMNNLDAAIPLYVSVISQSVGNNWYFAPNSSLQLGYIYEDKKQHDLARKYFTDVLTFKNHEYKNSLDNKAKAALNNYD